MARLPRPHISLHARIAVIERQITEAGRATVVFEDAPKAAQLAGLIRFLFGDAKVHLDHRPALALRRKVYRNGVHVDYEPRSADPDHLLYRVAEDHQRKTNGIRGDGVEFSDRILIKRERRRERKAADAKDLKKKRPKWRSAKKAKYRWPKRSFGRKATKDVHR